MGVRRYDPSTGRFLSIDPVPGGSADAYEYCNGDPISHYDLDGCFRGRVWRFVNGHRSATAGAAVGFGCGLAISATAGMALAGCVHAGGFVAGALAGASRGRRHRARHMFYGGISGSVYSAFGVGLGSGIRSGLGGLWRRWQRTRFEHVPYHFLR
ncbi:RHS repeat-associated core domain-containing protein [Streptomyces sp. MK5]|uniref:RHS repeat-associated core domain-containing protein n=1 Tax=Streptomyces sp. MK5 TaxID=3064253 RepID=UPI002741DB6E|nr:RHS repeat-associated core domain-containing protein [Streptomyces sp. MK5]